MDQLSDKDSEKLAYLFEHYEHYLLRIAEKYVGQTRNAEDIVIDAFIRIIPHLDKLDIHDGHKARNYLVTVVENLALDSLRKKTLLPFKEELLIDFFDPNSPETAAEKADLKECFVKAFEELSLRDEQILRLKYLQELSHREISELLGIKESAVRKRLERARKRLRKVMEGRSS